MKSTWKHIIRTAGVVLVLLAVWVTFDFFKNYPAKHFAAVEENILYRTGQPTADGWAVIHDKYRIKTVVDLRNSETESEWFKTEQQFCDENKVNRIRIPLWEVGFSDQARQDFFKIMADTKNHPVLIHCEAGSVRTGLMVASYRIMRQGWSYEKTIKEARSLGFSDTKYPQYADILKSFKSAKID